MNTKNLQTSVLDELNEIRNLCTIAKVASLNAPDDFDITELATQFTIIQNKANRLAEDLDTVHVHFVGGAS